MNRVTGFVVDQENLAGRLVEDTPIHAFFMLVARAADMTAVAMDRHVVRTCDAAVLGTALDTGALDRTNPVDCAVQDRG